jgi:hypothetical protein
VLRYLGGEPESAVYDRWVPTITSVPSTATIRFGAPKMVGIVWPISVRR